jgi:hypothetical protein
VRSSAGLHGARSSSRSGSTTAPTARRGFLVLQPGGSWTGPPVPAAKGRLRLLHGRPLLFLPSSLVHGGGGGLGGDQGDRRGIGFCRAAGLGFRLQRDGGDRFRAAWHASAGCRRARYEGWPSLPRWARPPLTREARASVSRKEKGAQGDWG